MTDHPTPDEVERAKKWAAMQNPPVTMLGPRFDSDGYWLESVPEWLVEANGGDHCGGGNTADAAWSALAIALRPVFASVGPVIAAEERERCATKAEHHHDCDMQMAGTPCNVPRDIAAAIRAMS